MIKETHFDSPRKLCLICVSAKLRSQYHNNVPHSAQFVPAATIYDLFTCFSINFMQKRTPKEYAFFFFSDPKLTGDAMNWNYNVIHFTDEKKRISLTLSNVSIILSQPSPLQQQA